MVIALMLVELKGTLLGNSDETEKEQPGTRHSLVNGMEKIRENMLKPENLTPCPSCGEPSGSSEPCVFCREFGTFAV